MFARNTCYATLMALAMLTTAAHAQEASWQGFPVHPPITEEDGPEAVHRDLHGAYDVIWMNGLVTDYEAGRITETDLMRELWAERADLLIALGEYYGSMELTRAFLVDLITAQSNGIIGVVDDQPIFFDPARYLDGEGNVLLGHARDYNTTNRANQILATVIMEIHEIDHAPIAWLMNRCCSSGAHCRKAQNEARCKMNANGDWCVNGSTACASGA